MAVLDQLVSANLALPILTLLLELLNSLLPVFILLPSLLMVCVLHCGLALQEMLGPDKWLCLSQILTTRTDNLEVGLLPV